MSVTYTPTTNFGAKDSLPSNDPSKVIKGSEFSVEFTAIQTAFSLAAPVASPTFTGTVTIPTADINGGNIDGTVIGAATPAAGSFTTGSFSGNVGIGTSSPAYSLTVQQAIDTYAFNIRDTIGNERILIGSRATAPIDNITPVQIANDNAGNLLLSSRTNSASGIKFYASSGTTASEAMRIDSAGRVGIGTTSPNATLKVQGPVDTATISTSSTPAARINNGGAISNWIGANGYNYGYIQSIQDDGTNNLKPLALQPLGGNVGIGVSSPTAKLHILADTPVLMNNAAGTSEGKFDFVDSGATLRMHNFFGSGSNITFLTNSSGGAVAERMRIDSSGNVITGSATANASDAVTLRQDGTAHVNNAQFSNGNGSAGGTTPSIYSPASAALAISTNSAERLRVDGSGNLLVGTTSSSGSSSNTQKVIGGNFATFSGGATIPASSTATILTLPTNKAGMYLIAGQFGVQNNDIYGSMMIVVANGTDFRVALNNSGSSATLSMSGANVQIANALGVPLDATATATFIGA